MLYNYWIVRFFVITFIMSVEITKWTIATETQLVVLWPLWEQFAAVSAFQMFCILLALKHIVCWVDTIFALADLARKFK